MRDLEEELGLLIDRLDDLANALQIPMRAELHIKAMKNSLPETVKDFKEIYVALFKNNPWEEQP